MIGDMNTPEGLQRVDCDLCGTNLGFQAEGTPIQRELWVHSRCPERLARRWSLTREQVENLTENIKTSIAACFPDFPRSDVASASTDNAIRESRSRMAAEYVLEWLGDWDVKEKAQ